MKTLYSAVAFISCSLLLAGCDERDSLPPSTIAPICAALIGPIKYNTENPESQRFAAAVLAMDLKERNRVGKALKCPKYRS